MSGFTGPINTLPVGATPLPTDEVPTWQGSGSSPYTRYVTWLQVFSAFSAVSSPHTAVSGNVPSFSDSTGKVIGDSGVTASTIVAGPASAVSGHVATFNGTGGKIIQDSGIVASALVSGPTASVIGHIATFSNTTGTIVQDSGMTASAIVAGPSASVIGHIATFSGTGGNTLQDSGITASAIISGPTASTSGHLVSFSGSGGNTVQDAGIVASAVVQGGTSSTVGHVVTFGSTNGRLIADGGFTVTTAMQPFVGAASLSASITTLFANNWETGRQTLTLTPNSTASTSPSSLGNIGSITTSFTGDLSHVGWAFPYTITGTATLGEPATGYQYTPELAQYFDYFLNQSGWNQQTTGNDGRTAATCHFTRIDQQGQGDCMGYVVIGTANSTKSGATNWLASPAISAYDADMQAGAAGVYLNPVEIDCTDKGFDCAGICFVGNMNRTVNTAALGEQWIGARLDSTGSKAVDAGVSLSGAFTLGLDMATATLGTSQAAITMKINQRHYFGATTTGSFPTNTTPAGPYITYDGTNLNLVGGSGGALEVSAGGALVTVVGELLVNGGPCLPQQDNVNSLGGSSNRWSQVYAGVGTINTSDENEKQDVAAIPAALLNAWDSMVPKTYRMIEAFERKGNAARYHIGYMAQDYAAALTANGETPAVWSSWCQDTLANNNLRQGLRYDEMFSLADGANKRRLGALEANVAALQTSLTAMTALVESQGATITTLSTAISSLQTAIAALQGAAPK